MKPTTYSASAGSGSPPTLEEVFSPSALVETYERLRTRRYDVIADRPRILPGSDRILLDEFHRDHNLHLRAIHRKVVQNRYTFSPFLGVEIPKSGTKETRPISVSTIRDSITQRALYQYLYPRIDPLLTESAYGYRTGRSAHDAIAAIKAHLNAGRTLIVDVDLTKFFDSVDHDILLAKIHKIGIDARAEQLVFRFLKTGRVEADDVAAQREPTSRQRKFKAALRSVGVPQGGVLSGLLSNLYLADFDKALSSQYRGYVRYADDFVICCSLSAECKHAYSLVEREIKPLRLTINPEKTRACVPTAEGIDFLGFRLNDKGIRVRGSNIHKFKNRIRHVIDTQRVFNTPQQTLRSLTWRLNYKIRGPSETQQKKLRDHMGVKHPHRRSWIGFFRIVTDIEQMRSLDRWIRREISAFMWRTHSSRVRYEEMHDAGLCSLVRCLFRARSKIPKMGESSVD